MARTSLRRLNPELRIVDERLTAWATWARTRQHHLGFPRVSAIARSIEFGRYGAIVDSGVQLTECPAHIAAIDKLVAQLPDPHRRAIVAHYNGTDVPREVRARMAKLPLDRFSRALAAGRWAIRVALDALG